MPAIGSDVSFGHRNRGARGDVAGAAKAVGNLTDTSVVATGTIKPLAISGRVLFKNRRFLLTLVGTGFSWAF